MYLYIIIIITLWTLSPAPGAFEKERRIYETIKNLSQNALTGNRHELVFFNNLIVYARDGPKYISEM